ncbi:MAG: hypothetical protein GY701_33745 [Sulfitobacter sp.]|nr:hypothetical protein [Sulfitobacter sp.]
MVGDVLHERRDGARNEAAEVASVIRLRPPRPTGSDLDNLTRDASRQFIGSTK